MRLGSLFLLLLLLASVHGFSVSSKPFKAAKSRAPLKHGDSWEQYERDISTVLQRLRADELDSSLREPFAKDQSLSYTTLWGSKEWDRHISRYRYVRVVLCWPTSRLLTRILPQFVVTLSWACLAMIVIDTRSASGELLGDFELSLTSLTLISGFVATLLTLRSNQGLDRLNEARRNVEKSLLHVKDSATLVMSYVYPKDPDLAILYARYLSIFGWIFKGHLRESDESDIVKTMLATEEDRNFILSQRNRPVAVLTRLRQIVAHCADRGMFRVPQHTALERDIYNLQQIVTACERILTTPIPPIYTTHTSRLLIFYLACLPFALHSGGLSEKTTIFTTAAASFAMLGLDEIGHLLEQPFQLMPLYQSAKVSTMDVADAFCSPPPELPEGEKFGL